MIWCVFDRDDNTNAMLSKAKQVAIKEGYQIAFSNPSFEVWFLLHFNNQTTPVENCEAAIKLLKKKGRLEQYEKNKEVYEQLKPLQEAAIDRARQILDPLIEYDRRREGVLLETLQIYLIDCDCSYKQTAALTYTHQNTVQYRVRKAMSLLGGNFEQAAALSAVFHAICLYRQDPQMFS